MVLALDDLLARMKDPSPNLEHVASTQIRMLNMDATRALNAAGAEKEMAAGDAVDGQSHPGESTDGLVDHEVLHEHKTLRDEHRRLACYEGQKMQSGPSVESWTRLA